MRSLTAGVNYDIYYKILYEALMELFLILEGDPEPATEEISYIYFQMACDAIIQTYRFKSIQELYEFLWHGKETNWKFE